MADKIVNYKALGDKIRDKRESLGLSQDSASERIGLSEAFYGNLERGTKIMSLESLVKIASGLNMSTDYLLMDSLPSDTDNENDKLQREFDNIFKGKTPQEKVQLLSILKLLADNMENVNPL